MSSHCIAAAVIHHLYEFQGNGTHVNLPLAGENVLPDIETPSPYLFQNFTRPLLIALVAVCVALYVFVYSTLSHLHSFQGPAWAAFTNWWYFKQLLGGRQHIEFHRVSQRYGRSLAALVLMLAADIGIGKFARIGPNRLICSDADFLRSMFGVRSLYRRPGTYTGFRLQPGRDNVLTELNENRHQLMRGKLANLYNGKSSPHLEAVIDRHILSLTEMIKKKYISDSSDYKPLDFGVASTVMAVNVASQFAFSHPIQDTKNCDRDLTGYMDGILQSLPVMQTLIAFPILINISTSKLASRLVEKTKSASSGLGFIYGFARDRTLERYGPNKKHHSDILGGMVERGMSLSEAESESLLAAMAGADPVATAIRVNILYVLTNPLIYNRLMSELRSQGLLSSASIVTYREIRTLPYLSAIIKESFRIFPPFVGLMEKQVPPGGDHTPDGRFVPGGTIIGASIVALLRDISVFGPDVETFRPERWLHCSEAEKLRMEQSVDLVFSGGRYTCLGKEVAIMEIYKVVFELFRQFQISIVDPLKPWESVAMGIFVQKEMWLRFEGRGGSYE